MTERFYCEQTNADKEKIKKIEAEKSKKYQAPIDPRKVDRIENEKKKGKNT